jgi:hypothetical protein
MVRIYYATRIGAGTLGDPRRSVLNNFVDAGAGEWFDEIESPTLGRSFCTVHASQATHDAIMAHRLSDPASVRFVGRMVPDKASLSAEFSSEWSSLPGIARREVLKVLADLGIGPRDIDGRATMKDVLGMALGKCLRHQQESAGLEPREVRGIKFAGETF